MKANDVTILDLRGLTVVADYFVIASAVAEVQVRSIVEKIQDELLVNHGQHLRREGWGDGRWVLLDYGDVVVHVFKQEDREYYDLERLWGDAPRLGIASDPHPVLVTQER